MYFLVSDRFQFLMGWSAKCGCSSLKHWYLDIHHIRPTDPTTNVHKTIGYGNTPFSKVEWEKRARYHDYTKHVVVRNPYSRVVSGFLNKYVVKKDLRNRGWDSFAELLLFLRDDHGFKLIDKHHFTPQFSEEYGRFSKFGMQFNNVIPLEQLQESLNAITTASGVAAKPIRNANSTNYIESELGEHCWAETSISGLGKGPFPPFESFYNRESKAVVDEIYRIDFEKLRAFGLNYKLGHVDSMSSAK